MRFSFCTNLVIQKRAHSCKRAPSSPSISKNVNESLVSHNSSRPFDAFRLPKRARRAKARHIYPCHFRKAPLGGVVVVKLVVLLKIHLQLIHTFLHFELLFFGFEEFSQIVRSCNSKKCSTVQQLKNDLQSHRILYSPCLRYVDILTLIVIKMLLKAHSF